MRINHNINATVTQNSLTLNNKSLSKSLEKLSTGLRINRSSDDAAGLSVSESLRKQVRGLDQARRNAEDGIALLKIAEGAAGEINNMLQRMRELAIQSSNDTLTTTERGYTDQEFQALMTEINRISNSAQYNGMTLLDGRAGSFGAAGSVSSVLHIGANNNGGSTSGTVDTMTVAVDSLTLGALGMTLSTSAVSGTNVTSQSNSFAAITSIDTAMKSVNNMRSDLGAYVNRLEFAIANLANQSYNSQDAEARIRDVDFASETTEFTRSQILSQSATAMLSQANQVPQSVLSLLG